MGRQTPESPGTLNITQLHNLSMLNSRPPLRDVDGSFSTTEDGFIYIKHDLVCVIPDTMNVLMQSSVHR